MTMIECINLYLLQNLFVVFVLFGIEQIYTWDVYILFKTSWVTVTTWITSHSYDLEALSAEHRHFCREKLNQVLF